MLYPDPTFTYDLARQRQHDLASAAEWERLARMARAATNVRRHMAARQRLTATWQRLSRSLKGGSVSRRALPTRRLAPQATPSVGQN